VTPNHCTDQERAQQPQKMSMPDAQEYEPETAFSAALSLLIIRLALVICMTVILIPLCHIIGCLRVVDLLMFCVCVVLIPVCSALSCCKLAVGAVQRLKT